MRYILAILSCCLSLLPAHADERMLELPRWFELLYLNGQGAPSTSLLGPRDYPLQAGNNLIVVRYGDNIELRADDSQIITSEPQAIWFEAGATGRYHLSSARPATLAEAETFARAPQLQLLLEGESLAFTQRPLSGLGALPSQRELELAIRAATPHAVSQPVANQGKEELNDGLPATLEPQRFEELQRLYRSSNPVTRKRFRHWLIEQE